ncbi:MAG: DUF1743 domain-containing protein [Halobacteriaceae archaeon]
MTVVGLDDTDSRQGGMCTTYVATRIAQTLRNRGASVDPPFLVRLNPAVPHKTRGNAALAVRTDAPAEDAAAVAAEWIERTAVTDDTRTNPGCVVAPTSWTQREPPPADVVTFAEHAIRGHHTIAEARARLDALEWRHRAWGNGRGLIGALAAVGAPAASPDTTFEYIAYREPSRRGTPRDVDESELFEVAAAAYPGAWDTVDREAGEAVCIPNTPGPILYGIRGDDPGAVRGVAEAVDSEPIERTALFVTNQGTDAHLREAAVGAVDDGYAYRLTGTVVSAPQSRQGGHVHLELEGLDGTSLPCVAFEPTKRFRDHVRTLRVGDRITVCGEVSEGTLKLEKFALRDAVRTTTETPTCPDCGRRMKSAGADAGYRCRDCATSRSGLVQRPVERALTVGWYEVPPRARRHIAKPLIRGGFDAPTHPER